MGSPDGAPGDGPVPGGRQREWWRESVLDSTEPSDGSLNMDENEIRDAVNDFEVPAPVDTPIITQDVSRSSGSALAGSPTPPVRSTIVLFNKLVDELSDVPAHPAIGESNTFSGLDRFSTGGNNSVEGSTGDAFGKSLWTPAPEGDIPDVPPMAHTQNGENVRFHEPNQLLNMSDEDMARSKKSHDKIKGRRKTTPVITALDLAEAAAADGGLGSVEEQGFSQEVINIDGAAVNFGDDPAVERTPSERERHERSHNKIMRRQQTGLPSTQPDSGISGQSSQLPTSAEGEIRQRRVITATESESDKRRDDEWIDSAVVESELGDNRDRSDIMESLKGMYDDFPDRRIRSSSNSDDRFGLSSNSSWRRPQRGRIVNRSTRSQSVGATLGSSDSSSDKIFTAEEIHRRRSRKREMRAAKARAQRDSELTFKPVINNFDSSRCDTFVRGEFVKQMEHDIRKRKEAMIEATRRRDQEIMEEVTFKPVTLDYDHGRNTSMAIHDRLYECAVDSIVRREQISQQEPNYLNLNPSRHQLETCERLYNDAALMEQRRQYHREQIAIEEERRRDRTKISAGSIKYAQQRLQKNLQECVQGTMTAPPMSGEGIPPETPLTYPQLIRVFKSMGFYSSEASDKNTKHAEVLSPEEIMIHDRLVQYLDPNGDGNVKFRAVAEFLDTFVLKFQREGFRQRVCIPISRRGPWKPTSPRDKKFDGFQAAESPAAASIPSPRISRQPIRDNPSGVLEEVTFETGEMLDLTEQFRQLIDRQLTTAPAYSKSRNDQPKGVRQKPEKLRFRDTKRTPQQQLDRAESIMRWHAVAKEKRLEKQYEKQEAELEGCTFQPKINAADDIPKVLPRAKKLLQERSKRPTRDTVEELYHKHEEIEMKRKQERIMKSHEQEQQFQKQCPFKPRSFASVELTSSQASSSFPKGFEKAVVRMSVPRMQQQKRESEALKRRQDYERLLKKRKQKKKNMMQDIEDAEKESLKSPPLLVVDVQLGRRGTHKIEVRQGDDLAGLAQQFCKTHRLKKAVQTILESQLVAQMSELEEKNEEPTLNDNVNGQAFDSSRATAGPSPPRTLSSRTL